MSDYIKREDALEQFDYYDLGEYLTTQIRGMLMDVPSADVAPVRHGQWIESNLIKDGRIFICSNCNMAWVSKKRTMDGMNYCPNCGAKMDGGDDDEKRQV